MDFKFPDVGEGIHEGTIVSWHVKEGDTIEKDDVLCEVETDKAVVEIPSPEHGVVEKLYHKEGEVVKVGDVLVSYQKDDAHSQSTPNTNTAPIPDTPPESETPADAGGVVGAIVDSDGKTSGPLFDKVKKDEPSENKESEVKILPAIRKLAEEKGVDLATITGTGEGGRITKEDIAKAAQTEVKQDPSTWPESPPQADQDDNLGSESVEEDKEAKTSMVRQKYDFFGHIEYQKLSPVRKATIEHLKKNKDVIPVSQTHHVDVTDLSHYRKKVNEELSDDGYHFTFLPFIFMGIMEVIKTMPQFNAEWSEDFGELMLKKYVNLGFAVDSEAGLFVPVIRRADEKDIKAIAREISDLATKVKDRTIDKMDMMGASITVTNYGSLGSVHATPVINYPNTCILGIGAIQKTPKMIEGDLQERLIMPLTLSYDHRFIDGADAARFLNALSHELTDPLRFNYNLVS